jgi:hypothetical protein
LAKRKSHRREKKKKKKEKTRIDRTAAVFGSGAKSFFNTSRKAFSFRRGKKKKIFTEVQGGKPRQLLSNSLQYLRKDGVEKGSESLLTAFRDFSSATSCGEIGECLREDGGISRFGSSEDQSPCEHGHKRP